MPDIRSIPAATVPPARRGSLVVQKYGGSSVADAEGIMRVARRVVATRRAGDEVVVVVSAMGDTTDELVELAAQVSPDPGGREFDMLLSAGERISMALLAMAITALGHEARSFTGRQAGVITEPVHNGARIVEMAPDRILAALDAGSVPIVAGFQGVARETDTVTTLGRGGSDTTAVALAAALGARVCEIYTDVDGVFTADPRVAGKARKIDEISAVDMLELASAGSRVLLARCVEYARRHRVPLHVRSSFSGRDGTWVRDRQRSPEPSEPREPREGETEEMEDAIISGVAHDTSVARITVLDVPEGAGNAMRILRAVADAGIHLDLWARHTSTLSFTVPEAHGRAAVAALRRMRDDIGFRDVRHDTAVGKVSLVGAGIAADPRVTALFFEALDTAGAEVFMASTAQVRITALTREDDIAKAVLALHTAFGLDSDSGEAVVYAGSGR
ncbi:aspartate kinase [Streptantibioticus rubrisoli]|uniref:Aspartokinase n=1 Tax=Streptantibioticus rubrisoli TaxID=1387313 RepID=A0ABT1P7V8_9ACTN|nr:aspartate kinase [Streptantibioticus rubrisoli]MCQ4041455.1 aspartate kinase [Streptantibioticus rubrisoli]